MSRPRKYPQELLERGTRLVLESGRPVAQVARDLGVPAESLRPKIGESDIRKYRLRALTVERSRRRQLQSSPGTRTHNRREPATGLGAQFRITSVLTHHSYNRSRFWPRAYMKTFPPDHASSIQ